MLVLEIAVGIVLGVVLLSILPKVIELVTDGLGAIGKGFIPWVKNLFVAICGMVFFIGSGATALYLFTEKLELLPWWLSWILGLFVFPVLVFLIGDLIYKKIKRS